MKWSSFATAVLILLLALSYDTPVVFLPVTIVTFFVFGELCAFDIFFAVLYL